MIRLLATALALTAPLTVAAQSVAPAPPAAPVEHRLTPDEIAAAQADGAERNRAAELQAMTRGDVDLGYRAERPKQVHGEAGVGVDSLGGREVFGAVTTSLGSGASATVAGDYTRYGRQRRPF